MRAATYLSTVFDDADTIAAELVSSVSPRAAEGGIGFLFCNSQTDYGAIVEKVAAFCGFPVVGGTALGFPFTDAAGREVSAAFMILHKDGLEASVAVSEPLDQQRHGEQMRAVFEACGQGLDPEAKMVLPLFPLMPGLLTGVFIDDIFALADGIPVFGGTTTNDLISTKPAVFADGKAYSDRMVLVMLGGAIRPVFATGNLVSPTVEYAPTVTLSEGNEVLRVDDMTYCEYLSSIGISPEDRINGVDALMQYGPTPVIIENPEVPDSDVPEVRCISYTDMKRHSAVFSGPVPAGVKLRMSILRKQDVDDSVKDCLGKLHERMREARDEGYTYGALFCISCVARYFVFVGGDNSERALMTQAAEGLAPAGFYAFCEIGPSYTTAGKKLANRSHSASIAMCAL